MLSPMDDIDCFHRVHMMDYEPVMDLITLHSEVTAVISNNYLVADVLPLPGGVEFLIDVAIESECGLPDLTVECEVAITLLKLVNTSKFGVSPNRHSDRLALKRSDGLHKPS